MSGRSADFKSHFEPGDIHCRHGVFWAELSAAARDRLWEDGSPYVYLRNDHLYEQDGNPEVFVVVKGAVKMVARSAGGANAILGLRYAGQILGVEEAIQRRGPTQMRSAAQALGDVKALVFSVDKFLKYIQEDPGVQRAILQDQATRLGRADLRITSLVADPASQRLAKLLASLMPPLDMGPYMMAMLAGEKGRALAVDLTQEEMASLINASVRTVERTLRKLRLRGIITTDNRERNVRILKPNRLEAMAAGDEHI